MNEFLRKHGKIILSVMGVGLMFIWMIPNKQNAGASTRENVEIGRLAGKKITDSDLNSARNRLETLRRFGQWQSQEMVSVTNAIRGAYPPQQAVQLFKNQPNFPSQILLYFFTESLDQRDPSLHFYLLAMEAQKAGLTATYDEVQLRLANMGMTQEQFDNLLKQMGSGAPILRGGIADFVAILKMDDLAFSALRASMPEIQHLAADTRSEVTVRYVALDANMPSAGLAAPTPAEMEGQFNTYKDVLRPAAGQEPGEIQGHKFPFGYKYADRAKVEYLVFDHKAARTVLEKSLTAQQREEDALAARQYYKDHPDRFAVATTLPTTLPATAPASQPTTQPYAEVSGKLMDQMIDARVSKMLKQMADEAAKITGEPWKMLDNEGYREAVAPASWVSYEKLADQLARDPRFKGYRPTPVAPSDWQDHSSLASLKGIGDAMFLTQAAVYNFPDLVLHVREIQRSTKDPVLRPLQTGVEGPILSDSQDNFYLYRVREAQKSHAPAALDEVHEQVVSDIQKRKTFDAQSQKAAQLVPVAAAKGLAAAAEADKLVVKSPAPFTRLLQGSGATSMMAQRAPIEELKVLPEFSDAAFRLAQAGGSGATTSPTSRPAETQPAIKVAAVNAESRLEVFILELVNFHPLGIDEFNQLPSRRDFMGLAQAQAMGTFSPKWSGLTTVARRLNYVPAQPFPEGAE